MKQSEIIAHLKEMIINQTERVHQMQDDHSDKLSLSPSAESWNVLQCLEHLNRYAEFYVSSIDEKLSKKSSDNKNFQNKEFKGGYFGNRFAKDMLPQKDGSIRKMKTFKSKNPAKQEAKIDSLERFLEYQEAWLDILENLDRFDLNKNKCSLTIPLIKMNLGSTIRFVIYHQERHILQAEKVVGSI